MMAQFELVFDEGPGKTFRVPVSEAPITIGRAAEAHVRVEHPAVSRVHARLHAMEDHLILEYLGSRKGLKVNGHRTANATLKHGDKFEVGETLFVVNDLERGSSPSRKKLPPSVAEQHANNRLAIKKDARIHALFEQACVVSEQTSDPAQTVTAILELVLDLVDAQRCFFLWFGGEGSGVRVVGALAQNGNNKGPKLNGTLVSAVARLGAPMLKVDERALPAEARAGDRPSAMCIPLRVDRQVVGAVYADSGWSDGHFTTHSLQDLRALVQMIAPLLVRIGNGGGRQN